MAKPSKQVSTLLAQREAVVKFGRMALQSDDLGEILAEACRLTRDAMGTEFSKIMELQDDRRTLLVIAGVGWKDGVVGEERIPAIEHSSEGYALQSGAATVSEDIGEEERFDYADFLKRHGVKSMVNVVIPGADGAPPFGLLQVDSRRKRSFDDSDVEFLQGYANVIGAAIERHRAQAALAESLQTQERLYDELQHRIGNNISVIHALLKMKAHRSAHPAVKQQIAEVLQQIDVLKQVYRQLYSSRKIETVDLGGYLSGLCNGVVSFNAPDRHEVRVEAKTEVVSVEPEIAVPLGLVTNEFVTNSLKHAGRQTGLKISLTLSLEDNVLALTLADNGKGLGDALEKKNAEGSGSGITLVEGLLRQIRSDWEWSGKGGVRLSIRIPLSTGPARGAGPSS